MSLLTRAAATLAASAVVLAPGALVLSPAHAANPAASPSSDPFYGYGSDGTTPVTPPAGLQPGETLPGGSRTVPLSTMVDVANAQMFASTDPSTKAAARSFSITATQLLYRTQNERAKPSATVTTVLQPGDLAHPVPSKGVVAYLSYYDGLSNSCDPSYTMQDDSINGEKAVIGSLLELGYTVTVPDFEGETLDWAAGHESGWNTLDAIRATERELGMPAATTKVGMIGYSGGSIAGEWASELAPSYAPELDLVGTAIGGVPANLRDLVNYVNSSADKDRNDWFGVIPAATVALGRATGLDFGKYESAFGKDAATYVSDKCIADFAGHYPGKHLADLVKPGIDFLNEPDVKPIVDGLTMGKGTTPTVPMLMVNGNDDGIGDGVMIAADVQALATKYCRAGLPVQYSEVPGAHGDVGMPFMIQGISYLDKWFAGTATSSDYNCAALIAADAHPNPPTPSVDYVRPSLHGHSKGHRDILVVKAKGATGAKVKLFRAGHKKAIGHDKVNKHGKAIIKVHDRNGSAKTRYHAVVKATATTRRATTKKVALR